MNVLTDELLHEVCAAAISARLERDALLVLIEPALVATIPRASTAAGQILCDLSTLRSYGELPSGAVPLRTWLTTAASLAKLRREEEVFARALRVLSRAGGASSAPDSKRSVLLDPTLPGAPELFVGRAREVELMKRTLGVVGAGGDGHAKTHLLVSVRGMPGIGKTALARWLAHDPEVNERFSGGVLWWTLGTSPQLESDLARWGRLLVGSDDLYGESSLQRITARLSSAIGEKQILVVADDVWRAEHAAVIRRALGPRCVLLVTTRNTELAHNLIAYPGALHTIPALQPDDAFELLARLAPASTRAEPERCRRLVAHLGCLPLAIQVAGRMLARESELGVGVRPLLDELIGQPEARDMVLDATVPMDAMPLERLATPTVRATLQRSVDFLSMEARERLAFLAGLEGRFTLRDIAEIWQTPNPLPTLRELAGLGLLEPLGGGELQIHVLVSALARLLCAEESDAAPG